ncbi:MAG: hypothetical protein IT445_01190 [Phycisphaeraceae bacterium]|nr:hypothetical protein [Phycisphaeraceae bacterium]
MRRSNGILRRKLVVVLAATALLLSGGGLVQCYGANGGHAAVELPHLSVCVEFASLPTVDWGPASLELSGADCFDVPLPPVVSCKTGPGRKYFAVVSLSLPWICVISWADLSSSSATHEHSVFDKRMHAEQSKRSLYSTVLLI